VLLGNIPWEFLAVDFINDDALPDISVDLSNIPSAR
jgi:hypothetical protein